MSVSIKVCIRCRPFTIDDTLGVVMSQKGDEEGEVELINSSYSTTRFAFSWSWWSAYGYKRHVKGDTLPADNMLLVDQTMAYEACGSKIKADLLGGNAVVMFAYGLSGSGKTFTVFGPDAVDIPEAWFKHEEPHPMWGIFPRLAYELFKEKQDGWKITMKYFQNVVDTVRDLMSPMAQEQQYKNGMRKDPDGFMDIEWCQGVVLKDWNDLRKTFMSANSRKAIAPTQFNHQSTRGHCIMTLEVEKPDPEREGMKQRGRIYVCDLAGTEPAGDVVYANYQKIQFDDGTIEMKYLGPHQDPAKSKELQDQGKKINLSLTEMAQFFMKMAEAVQKKTLKPGASIPGCNSYFLCKYLKDTMLQARTYLFCAVRPEVTYHNYTFSTLGFAKNASVIKLQPKKASTAASPAERKLMAELDEMKNLVAMLKAENEKMAKGGGGGGGAGSEQVDKLSELLAMKQKQLENVLNGDDDGGGDGGGSGVKSAAKMQEETMQRQKEEYEKRGISLTFFEDKTTLPYLINLDVDAYRSMRFMFILSKPATVVGTKGDIKPMSLSIVDDHCSFEKSPEAVGDDGVDAGSIVTLVVGRGEVVHNGKKLESGARVALAAFDRVAIGNELMLFRYPGRETAGAEPPTADDAAKEYQEALQSQDKDAMKALEAQKRQFEEERAAWEAQKAALEQLRSQAATSHASAEEVAEQEKKLQELAQQEKERLARQVNDQELRDVLPKINELKQIVGVLNRDMLSFETALKGAGGDGEGIPQVKVKVHNSKTDETILLDVFEFVKAYALLKDEVAFLKNAITNNREYSSPPGHDPITLLFDNSFHVGSVTSFPEYLLYNLETDPDESKMNLKNAVPPFNTIGKLEVVWTPLSSEDETKHDPSAVDDVDGPDDLVGKPWTYKLEIKQALGLPMITDLAYCQYEFLGEIFTTESVEQNTRNPVFNYSHVHHVPCVTAEFVQYLQSHRLEFQLFINPYIMDPPKDAISTTNDAIVRNLGGTVQVKAPYEELEAKVNLLEASRGKLADEVAYLRQVYKKATGSDAPPFDGAAAAAAVAAGDGKSTPRSKLETAKSRDSLLNATSS